MSESNFPAGNYHYSTSSIYRDTRVEGTGKTVFSSDVEKIIDKAAMIAEEVLPKKDKSPKIVYVERDTHYVPVYGHYYYPHYYTGYYNVPSYSFFGPRFHVTQVHEAPKTEKKREKEKEDAARLIVGIALGVVVAASAYYAGKDLSTTMSANEDLSRIENEKEKKIYRYVENHVDHPHLNKIKEIVECEEKILRRVKMDAQSGLMLKASTLFFGAIGIAGAVVTAPTLMIGGAVATGITGCGMLLKAGFNKIAEKNARDAKEILRNIKDLKNIQQPLNVNRSF